MPSVASTLPAVPARPQDGGTIADAEWRSVREAAPGAGRAWVEAAAKLGHPEAQAVLGQWLLEGRGGNADAEQALHWFLAGADLGHPMAMNMAGRCHEQGWGTTADELKAAGWYRRAARLGLPHAQYNLANLLAAGKVLASDHVEAHGLYEQAAAQGYAKAFAKLGRYHEDGLVVPRDDEAAFDCYRRGAEGGDFRGQFCYAGMLAARGRDDEALRWLARVPETATLRYLRMAGEKLVGSPDARFRVIGEAMLARA